MILYGIHGLITAVFVGSGKPQVESASRIIELIITASCCWLLIPVYSGMGAAIALLAGKGMALLTYVLLRSSNSTISKGIFSIFSFVDREVFTPDVEQSKND